MDYGSHDGRVLFIAAKPDIRKPAGKTDTYISLPGVTICKNIQIHFDTFRPILPKSTA